MRISALIPSYNESKTIGLLVKEIKGQGLDVIVVDDGSVDRTAEIAKMAGADILRHQENQGKGASLKDGFHYVLNKNYDAVITIDGDGQHSPGDISQFIQAAGRPEIDMVVGNRMHFSKGMPLIRWLTNNFMSFLLSLICWQYIPDSQCGFRLIKKRVLEELSFTTANYEIESEILIAMRNKGFKTKFIPIQTIYAKEGSQINPIVDAIRFFRFLLKSLCPSLFNKKIA